MKERAKSAAKAPAKTARAPKRAVKTEKTAGTKLPAKKASRKKAAKEPDVKSPVAAARKNAKAGELTTKAKPKAVAAKTGKKTKAKTGADLAGIDESVLDPIGDTTDGEGRTYLGAAAVPAANAEADAFRKETEIEASDAMVEAGPGMEATEARARSEAVKTAARADAAAARIGDPGARAEAREPAKLERLQKILSQAGIASRRHAEEMITEGRVMVNGQVVTTLGSKADANHDHIRVDGKLLHGAERHRYFVLNKPRGYVTTVSDPEGRPTVMKFFEKMHERLYPVGRLDFQSEGLLLMTNDGELANLLTKAGSGVEKTYLVKVAGRPTEQELDKLRGGVTIERGEAGSGRVETAPAHVRQVRVGDNPWFEVVLTEGRNRELRKMFAAVGHFVEKIRRVGYGPLTLDVEPGKMRELTADEVRVLRLTAEGKMKPRRLNVDRALPKEAGKPAEQQRRFAEKRERSGKPRFQREERGQKKEWRPGKPEFGARREGRPFSGPKPEFEKRSFGRPRFEKPGFERPAGAGGRPGFGGRGARRTFSGSKPEFEKRSFDRPRFEKPGFGGLHIEPQTERPAGFRDRPKFEGRKPFGGERKPFGAGRPSSGPRREFDRPRSDRPGPDGPRFDRPETGKPRFGKRGFEKRSFDKPRFDKPAFGGAPRGPSVGRRENEPRAPFRPQGDRPSFKPGGAGRPRTGFGGRPGGFSKPNRPGGFAKSNRTGGFKRPNKPGGAGRGGARFGGGRPGGR